MMKSSVKVIAIAMILTVSACADLSYYLYSVKGQLSVMHKARDIEDVLKDKSTQQSLREKLELVERIRQFAFLKIKLPVSDSYTQYADLGRPYVLKNLFAADEFSISLQRWCYPIVGCAGYRGYFDEGMLEAFKLTLEQQGKDTYVANIPAYSTLGWFDDPVLNTFINWPEYRLAGLIFHELAHQRLYIDNDSQFNESFAMTIQQDAVEKWLQDSAQISQLKRYRQTIKNRQAVIKLIEQGRKQLKALYEQDLNEDDKRLGKHNTMKKIRASYQRLSAGFDSPDGFAYWFKGALNNAKLASVSTYYYQVDAFKAILLHYAGDHSKFYRHVERLGKMPKVERQGCLDYWRSPEGEVGLC